MARSAQATFIYRGHGIEFCVYADRLTVTSGHDPAATAHTYALDRVRDIAIEPPAYLVLTLADGERLRVPLGTAVDRARDALVRAR